MMADTKPDWLLEDISLQILLKASTLVLCRSDRLIGHILSQTKQS